MFSDPSDESGDDTLDHEIALELASLALDLPETVPESCLIIPGAEPLSRTVSEGTLSEPDPAKYQFLPSLKNEMKFALSVEGSESDGGVGAFFESETMNLQDMEGFPELRDISTSKDVVGFVEKLLEMMKQNLWGWDEFRAFLPQVLMAAAAGMRQEEKLNFVVEFTLDVIVMLCKRLEQLKGQSWSKKVNMPKLIIRCLPKDGSQFKYSEKHQSKVQTMKDEVNPTLYAELCERLHVVIPKHVSVVMTRRMIETKQFQKALQFAMQTNIVDQFSETEILLPPITAKLFGAVIEFLDYIRNRSELFVMAEKFCKFAIEKIAERGAGDSPAFSIQLCRRLGFPDDEFGRVFYLQRKKILRWCVSIGKAEEFESILCYGSYNDKMLQRYVCRQLRKKKDFGTLHSLCQKYNLSQDPEFVDFLNLNPTSSDLLTCISEVLNLEVLDMPFDKIIVVSDEKSFETAQECWEKSSPKIIGLDMEQVPLSLMDFYPLSTSCQLLQVGFESHAIIFDLQSACTASFVDSFLTSVLTDPSIIKVGMDFPNDLNLLRRDFPSLKCLASDMSSYFELHHTLGLLKESKEEQILLKKNRRFGKKKQKEGGLAKLVRHKLRKKLDKSEQISDWGRRPLRTSQLKYAAIDALCCIEIYKNLLKSK